MDDVFAEIREDAFDQAVGSHQRDRAEHDAGHRERGPAPVPPDAAEGDPEVHG